MHRTRGAGGMTARRPHTFLVFGDDWGRHVSTLQHVFARLVASDYVIWIDSVGMREPRLSARDLRRAWGKMRALLVRAGPASGVRTPAQEDAARRPQQVIPPMVLPWHSHPVVARFNRWSLRRTARAALRRAPAGNPVVLVSALPTTAHAVGGCGEAASIYFCMDNYSHMPDTSPRTVEPMERLLLERVDAVVATAARLVELKRARSGKGYQLPQGCNYEHFSTQRPVPERLRHLPRPIIGFAGGFAGGGGQALDVGTIRAIAERHAEWSIVLVGPLEQLRPQLDLPNVHFTGAVSYAELPAHVQAFDVGLIPYQDNEWMRAVDPLKLLEYLAAGVAVVSSPLREAYKYESVVRIAPLGAPFVAAVEAALGSGPTERAAGRRLAAANTWQHRAERFLEIVDETLAGTAERRRSSVAAVPVSAGADSDG